MCRAIREGGESGADGSSRETCMQMDVNSMKPLDNLCHPVSVIADAERLALEAFGAPCVLMVGGTDLGGAEHGAGTVKRGENHSSQECPPRIMGALVLCGAVPVYVNPAGDKRLGIPLV